MSRNRNRHTNTNTNGAAEFPLVWNSFNHDTAAEGCRDMLQQIEGVKSALLGHIARETGAAPQDPERARNWDMVDHHVLITHLGPHRPEGHLELFQPGLQVWREVQDGRVVVRRDPHGHLAGLYGAIAHLAELGQRVNAWRHDLGHPEDLAMTWKASPAVESALEVMTAGQYQAWYQAAHQAVAQAARQVAALPQETPSIRPAPRADVAAVGPRIRQVMAARA